MTEPRPEILSETPLAQGGIRLRLFVPAAMPLFSGHFPGFPILPGVLQVHWAARLGAERFAISGGLSRMVNLKFQKLIPPDSELALDLNWDSTRRQLSFAFTSPLGAHASGKLEFAAVET